MPITRKQRFRSALALAGMTMTEWATEYGVTASHISQVLDDKRAGSGALEATIDRFIKTYHRAA